MKTFLRSYKIPQSILETHNSDMNANKIFCRYSNPLSQVKAYCPNTSNPMERTHQILPLNTKSTFHGNETAMERWQTEVTGQA